MDSLLTQAEKLFQAGNIPQALETFDKVLEIFPDLADAHNSRGVCLAKLGQFQTAYDAFARALTLRSDLGILYYNLAQVSKFLGKDDEAQRHFETYRALTHRGCPYFSGLARDRVDEVHIVPDYSERDFHSLLTKGFRRTGRTLSQNICSTCQRCVQIRLLPQEYKPSKSQQRVRKKASDLLIQPGLAQDLTQEKLDLFNRYVIERHKWEKGEYYPVAEENHKVWNGTLELDTFYGDKLIAVGLVDRALDSLYASSFYYDIDYSSYSLGVLNIMNWLDWGRDNGIRYFYLGEYLLEKSNMIYKKSFLPHEILLAGQWVRV